MAEDGALSTIRFQPSIGIIVIYLFFIILFIFYFLGEALPTKARILCLDS